MNSVRDETALTRERPKAAQNEGVKQAKSEIAEAGSNLLGANSREAIDIAIKSQRNAGEPPAEVPGAAVEAYFKPYRSSSTARGSRPIDALLANLNELYRQLTLAASNPRRRNRRWSKSRSRWRACAPT